MALPCLLLTYHYYSTSTYLTYYYLHLTYKLAVVAARLALYRLAKVLVVQLAVLGRRPT